MYNGRNSFVKEAVACNLNTCCQFADDIVKFVAVPHCSSLWATTVSEGDVTI